MALAPTAFTLLGLVAWAIFVAVLLVSHRGLFVFAGRQAVNGFAADGSNAPSAFNQRLVRVHANCVENLPMQAALLLFALATQRTGITDPLAPVLLGARIFQSTVHMLGTTQLLVWTRASAFFLQLGILGFWIAGFLGGG